MQHHAMTDRHVRADDQRASTRAMDSIVRDMQHRAILDAGARADRDRMHVAANDRRRPDGRVVADARPDR